MDSQGGADNQETKFDAVSERVNGIINQLKSLRYECVNCLSTIRHDKAVFSCSDCYCIFHLYCIKQWAKESVSGGGLSFRCPHCQAVQQTDLKYYCFCGKLRDPKYDPHITPHSCGDRCGKSLSNHCDHTCPLPCHPGPCPPCTAAAGPGSCGCGAISYTWTCGRPDPLKTCGKPCGKPLSCGKHRCSDQCHHGECRSCLEQSNVSCYCGAEMKMVPCGSTAFSCGKVCGKKLRCGVHHCEEVCHQDGCCPCETDPGVVKTCPCGSTPLSVVRLRCSDPIPVCDKVCGRWLNCGEHRCESNCHEGRCEPCKRQVEITCPCGKTQATVPCPMRHRFRCNKVCKVALSCGKHHCRTRCCSLTKNDGGTHRCEYVCNKKLSCGHSCMEMCHRGPCPLCPNFIVERLRCRCGAEEIMPPQPCGTKPPLCSRPCGIVRACGHPTGSHTCHYGDCPPCVFPVERLCAGEHKVMKNVPCGTELPTCGGKCGKQLTCGHKCTRFCHAGPCADEKHPCKQLCGRALELCGHVCLSKCHGRNDCPACSTVEERRCECGRQIKKFSCKKLIHFKSIRSGKDVVVECDADCLAAQRLEILSSRIKPPLPVKYSIFLWETALADIGQIRKLEKLLHDFVASKEEFRCLGAMPSPKRAVVHSMCHYYHIGSESVDREPHRSCLLTKTPKTKVPNPLLSVAVEAAERHSPLLFIERIRQREEMIADHTLNIEGENASIVTVSRALRDFAGQFVCEEGDRMNNVTHLRLFFVERSKRGDAYRHLQAIKPPFEFSIPTAVHNGNPKLVSSSWAKVGNWREISR